MNLLERSQVLAGEIALNQKESVDSDAVKILQERVDQIVPLSSDVDKLTDSVNLLRDITENVDSVRFDVRRFTSQAEQFDKEFGTDPDSATDPNES